MAELPQGVHRHERGYDNSIAQNCVRRKLIAQPNVARDRSDGAIGQGGDDLTGGVNDRAYAGVRGTHEPPDRQSRRGGDIRLDAARSTAYEKVVLPQVSGIPSYFLMWGAAAVLGVGVGLRLARSAGFPGGKSLGALLILALCIVVGSKFLFLAESVLFPLDDVLPTPQSGWPAVLSHGFRNPGGLVLLAIAMPFVCVAFRLPTLSFADAVLPAAGIAIFFFRIGCFLNGCCFSWATQCPLAAR